MVRVIFFAMMIMLVINLGAAGFAKGMLIGHWSGQGKNRHAHYEFRSDGTYLRQDVINGKKIASAGRWEMVGFKLVLTPNLDWSKGPHEPEKIVRRVKLLTTAEFRTVEEKMGVKKLVIYHRE